jgi:hypothetical protein
LVFVLSFVIYHFDQGLAYSSHQMTLPLFPQKKNNNHNIHQKQFNSLPETALLNVAGQKHKMSWLLSP